MDEKTHLRQIRRIVTVLRRKGWNTRDDIRDALDADADFTAIKGIGPVLAPVLETLLELDDVVFTALTTMPCYHWQAQPHPETRGDNEPHPTYDPEGV